MNGDFTAITVIFDPETNTARVDLGGCDPVRAAALLNEAVDQIESVMQYPQWTVVVDGVEYVADLYQAVDEEEEGE